jgi:hypothetical protein
VTDTSMPEAILRMPETLQRMAGAGRISAEDVLVLRRKVFSDGVVQATRPNGCSPSMMPAARTSAPEWPVFFVEALVDYTVHQAEPHGYVSPTTPNGSSRGSRAAASSRPRRSLSCW